MDSITKKYIQAHNNDFSLEMVMYLSQLEMIASKDKDVAKLIVMELEDQRENNLKLIASENFSSIAVQSAMGNLLTDKYSEGFPFHRFYAGCQNVDEIEALACEKAKKLFNAEHGYE